MRRCTSVVSVLGFLAISAGVCAGGRTARDGGLGIAPGDRGGFAVRTFADGTWRTVGELEYDGFVRDRTILLPAAALTADGVRVRLVQYGGGAAFIDEVSLDGMPPLRVDGIDEAHAAALMASRDNDLVDVHHRTTQLTFAPTPGEGVLRLGARIEGPVVVGSPFSFPPANLFFAVTPSSKFYVYTPVTGGEAPNWPAELDPARALFAEYCRPTTGHPDGVTYGWVTNDGEALYAAVEFTADNTRDGNKDFSSLFVRRGDDVREFRITEADTKWGRPNFMATERAPYRHKLYTFTIPLSEIGVMADGKLGTVELAFEAYGTAAVALTLDPTYWDFGPTLVGGTSPARTFTVTNNTQVGFTLGTLLRSGPDSAVFPLSTGSCEDGAPIAPGGGSCTFEVSFSPVAVGGFQDSIVASGVFVTGAPGSATALVVGQGMAQVSTISAKGVALFVVLLLLVGIHVLRRSW